MSQTTPGRRLSGRRVRLDTTTVLAVLLPLVTVGALLLVRGGGDSVAEPHPPTRTSLKSATIVCPSALPGSPAAYLSTVGDGARGEVEVRAGSEKDTARLQEGRVTTVRPGTGPVAVDGEDDLAAGLLGARFGGAQLASTACPATSPHQWFTGVGAAVRHDSVLEVVNPDAGRAVADVTVYAGTGAVDVPRLRGVSVPGHSSVRLDLGAVAPRRGELALQVVTSRGRLAYSVLDSSDELGRGQASQDWLPGQADPATDNLVLGLAGGAGSRLLTLANGGDDEVRAQVKFVSEDSVFAPEGLDEVRVPPQGVARLSLTDALQSAVADGVVGLEVTSTQPVTATLRSFVDGDLSHAVGAPPIRHGASAIVPTGAKRVVLAGARSVGAVTVVSRSASGEELDRTRADLRPGRGAVVTVPPRATLVSVVPQNTSVTGSVIVSGRGAAVVPLVDPVLSGLVPDVRPGLS
ncbi:hypothetical protein GCM10009844_00120 [Nocardioides koreensis]|uniref:Secreted protein n=1 Tax=Nocardioides koreensis TaxID=433651 RepID=A0ABP5KSR2_9ACTN